MGGRRRVLTAEVYILSRQC